MTTNGPMRMAGHVSARCLRCQRDVFVPEGTLRCPYGDHDVERTSLPRMPKPVPRVGPPETPAPPPDRAPVVPESRPSVERIALPHWMDEGRIWLTATKRFAKALATEDADLTAEVRQVRGLRKLLDAVLDKIEPPDSGATP